jgi:hypothetical protein
MPALELVADPANDVVEREMAKLFRHLRVEDHLELEIAKLIGERVHVATVDRIGDLIGFLDRVGGDRLEALLKVPRAAALRVAKPAHDRDQALEIHGAALMRGRLSAAGTAPPASLIICIM